MNTRAIGARSRIFILGLTSKLCHRLLAASSESGLEFVAFMAISSPERQPVDSSALLAAWVIVVEATVNVPIVDLLVNAGERSES